MSSRVLSPPKIEANLNLEPKFLTRLDSVLILIINNLVLMHSDFGCDQAVLPTEKLEPEAVASIPTEGNEYNNQQIKKIF